MTAGHLHVPLMLVLLLGLQVPNTPASPTQTPTTANLPAPVSAPSDTVSNVVVAAFTVVLALLAIVHAIIMARTNAHTRATEKAYVGIHHHGRGVFLHDDMDGGRILLRLTNHGRTPAEVLGGTIECDYDPESGDRFTLVGPEIIPPCYIHPGERVDLMPVLLRTIPTSHWRVTATIEYIDCFKQRNRAAYARRYFPLGQHDGFGGSNLIVFSEDADRNFDRVTHRPRWWQRV